MSVWGRVLLETQHFTWMMVQVRVSTRACPVQTAFCKVSCTHFLAEAVSAVALSGATIVCQAMHPTGITRTPPATLWGLQVCRTKLRRCLSMELVSFSWARQSRGTKLHCYLPCYQLFEQFENLVS